METQNSAQASTVSWLEIPTATDPEHWTGTKQMSSSPRPEQDEKIQDDRNIQNTRDEDSILIAWVELACLLHNTNELEIRQLFNVYKQVVRLEYSRKKQELTKHCLKIILIDTCQKVFPIVDLTSEDFGLKYSSLKMFDAKLCIVMVNIPIRVHGTNEFYSWNVF